MRLCTKKHGIYGHFSRISALSFPHLSLQPSVRLFEMISSSDEEFDEGSDVRINWDDYEPQSPIPHIAGEDEADEYRPQSPEFFLRYRFWSVSVFGRPILIFLTEYRPCWRNSEKVPCMFYRDFQLMLYLNHVRD